MPSNVLMFSLAQNGYDAIYSKCISSQRLYANKNSYDYVLFDRPRWVSSAKESAWLKVPLMLEALRMDYDWVFYIDADCEISLKTPRIESIEVPNKCLYFAHGHSGRINSGVMLVKNTTEAQSFFEKVLNSIENIDVPEEDRTAYENGHIIYYSKSCKDIHILDRRWNNTIDVNLNDYIRHYTGAMRQHYQRSIFSKIKVKLIKMQFQAFQRLNKTSIFHSESYVSLKERIEILAKISKTKFPLKSI